MNDKCRAKKIIKNITTLFLLVFTLVAWFGCSNKNGWTGSPGERNRVIIDDYPGLYASLTYRDGSGIIRFVNSPAPELRNYAWRALFHSNAEVNRELIELVKKSDEEAAWMMPGYYELDDSLLQLITEWWKDEEINRSYACKALGELGDEQVLEILLDHTDYLTSDPNCSLAAGRIVSTQNISDRLIVETAHVAFETVEQKIQLGLLYGFYRNASNRPEPGTPAYRILYEGWINSGPERDPVIDQYMVRILGQQAFVTVMESRDDISLNRHLHLAIELARETGFLSDIDLHQGMIERLLNHNSPHVVIQTLQSLAGNESAAESLLSHIETELVNPEIDGEIYLESLHLLKSEGKSIERYLEIVEGVVADNPFLTGRSFELYEGVVGDTEYLNRLDEQISRNGVPALHSMQALTGFWQKQGSGHPDANRIREMFWKGAESGFAPVLGAAEPLISNDDFLSDDDYDRLIAAIEKHDVTENIQLYRNLAGAVTSRFEQLADPFIETISEHGYNSLNNHLRELGWDIPADRDRSPAPFREPDWKLLYEMGTHPHWVLETDIGIIEVEMDPLGAPVTVSSINNLTRAGAYNGIPFHRVVPNFVVQGGDVGSSTGVGGPGYQIPIEPSTASFGRGMAGIASSGPDTEGSQFFFMNNWAPHLDGRYTIFGRVVEGMDVVDRIRVGNVVERAYIVLK